MEQQQTVQANVSDIRERFHKISSFQDRMQLTRMEEIGGISDVLQEIADLYQKYSDAMNKYRRILQEDMLQAKIRLEDLKEADEKILY